MVTGTSKTKSSLNERSFLDYVPHEMLAEIKGKMKTRTFPAGTIIFREGDPGDAYFSILEGRVRAFRKDEHGLVVDLAELGPGDGFGEIALLTGTPRNASAVAVEETVLTIVPKELFDQILEKYPMVALSFVKDISKMLLQDWSKLEQEAQLEYTVPKISTIDFLLICFITVVCGVLFNLANPNGITFWPETWAEDPIASVTPATAVQKVARENAIIIDARPASFFAQEHIAGAINVPSDIFDLVYLMELAHIDKSTEIVVYGRTISSHYDEVLVNRLRLRGHRNVTILAGGLSGWKNKGYAVEP